MRGAPKIDPTFGSFASDTPGGGGGVTPNPNTHDLFGVTPATTTGTGTHQTPADASLTINTHAQSQTQNVDLSSSSTSGPSTSTGVTRSKPRRHSVISPGGCETLNSNANSNRNSGELIGDINNNNSSSSNSNNKNEQTTVRRKSTSSIGIFVVTNENNISNDNNDNIDVRVRDNRKEAGYYKKAESGKHRPDRVSTSSADSSNTAAMDDNASRSKRVWKALSVASEGINKEKQKVLGFFRNRLRSKRGRKETSVKEIHIDPEIYDDKWASRAASSNSNTSRASSGSLKFSNGSGSHSSSSRESTTLEVVHDMEEEYNPEYR